MSLTQKTYPRKEGFYPLPRGDRELADFINVWIVLKQRDRTIDTLYDYWIREKSTPCPSRRTGPCSRTFSTGCREGLSRFPRIIGEKKCATLLTVKSVGDETGQSERGAPRENPGELVEDVGNGHLVPCEAPAQESTRGIPSR